jgi:hypothetical protein
LIRELDSKEEAARTEANIRQSEIAKVEEEDYEADVRK